MIACGSENEPLKINLEGVTMKSQSVLVLALACALAVSGCGDRGESVTAEEARAIAKEAYIYASPMVDGYRIIHTYYMSPGNPEYKGPMNQLVSEARVFTPEDKAVQTPNSDTPYSFFGADLRTEPLVLTVPEIDAKRYYSIQFVDAYTFNFHYVGSRTTGNGAGKFLLAGPGWKGEKPEGIKEVITSETNLVLGIYRTQLFGPDDLDNVKTIQAGYKLESLSEYLGTAAPIAAAAFDYVEPLSKEAQKTSPEAFGVLNFILTAYCPTVPSEAALMARFAKINVGPGRAFDLSAFSPKVQQAIKDGIADAWREFDEFKKKKIDTGEITSGELFGTREFLKNNYLYRMAAAVLGIYGNSEQEALYPLYSEDANGEKLDGSNRYTVRFAPGELPPVHAFWSLTMYELPESLLVANPIDRYLINSPMLPNLEKDADGGLTLYIQHDSPGKEKESNWLPAPQGPFMMAMRLYWPKNEALDGTWQAPKAKKVQ
jgi:hypothetical protein